ncbi:MAG: hypothetical protein ACI8X5_003993 [Planctomycetota bacterium]|jgi:hypothetical protein
MDELVTVHPYSFAGPIAASRDGKYAYMAEGGAVALVLADHTLSAAAGNYQAPLWRHPVGKTGVIPTEMSLDPEFNFTEPMTPNAPKNLLYIAGGRDGFWVMEASVVSIAPLGQWEPRPAYRIDNSGTTSVSTQNSRRWCNDVGFMTVNGNVYALALFARMDKSVLRVYDIDDVRDVAKYGTETGSEIQSLFNIKLESIPNVSGSAYAMGMDVDEVATDHSNVYVAMGEHGIFRVSFEDTGSGLVLSTPQSPVEHGPYFGDGSAYAGYNAPLYENVEYYEGNNHNSTLLLTHRPYFLDVAVENLASDSDRHRVYAAVDNLGWCAFSIKSSVAWDDDIWDPASGAHGYPDFIQEGKQKASTDQNSTKKMIRLATTAEDGNKASFARQIEVVTTRESSTSPYSTALIVSASSRRFIELPELKNEGRFLQWNLTLGPIHKKDKLNDYGGKHSLIIAYDLEHVGDTANGWVFNDDNYLGVSVGGTAFCAVEEPPMDQLHLFYGSSVPGGKLPDEDVDNSTSNNAVRVWYEDWPDGVNQLNLDHNWSEHDDFLTRGRYYRLGRITTSFGSSLIDPQILVSASNDAGVIPDGPPIFDLANKRITTPFASEGATVESTPVHVIPGSTLPTGQASELTYGVIMNPGGAFVKTDDGVDYEYRMGFSPRIVGQGYDTMCDDPPTTDGTDRWWLASRWKGNKFHATYDAGTGELTGVITDHQVFLTPPANKFSAGDYSQVAECQKPTWSGRAYYSTTTTFPEYNAYVALNYGTSVDSKGLLFATVNGSPQGLWALAMSKYEAVLDNGRDPIDNPTGDDVDHQVDPDQYVSNGVVRGALVTHPEYWNIPDVRTNPAITDANYFIQKSSGSSLADVQTWYPDLFKLPKPGGGEAWILAVPCGYSVLSENDGGVGGHSPSWDPDPRFTEAGGSFEHMMVRLFDVTDPTQLDTSGGLSAGYNDDSRDLPAYTILGPDAETSAIFVKSIKANDGTNDRHLLLVADLGGKVYLYDIEDLLDPANSAVDPPTTLPHSDQYGWFFDDAPLDTYETQTNLTDNYANGVWGCVVMDETWTDSSGSHAATYVYMGVPRIGIEVARLEFDSSQNPYLDYLGRIRTPGNLAWLEVEEFDPPLAGGTNKLLYVSDYNGGMRIYSHPAGGN